jgi:hypothetical protein
MKSNNKEQVQELLNKIREITGYGEELSLIVNHQIKAYNGSIDIPKIPGSIQVGKWEHVVDTSKYISYYDATDNIANNMVHDIIEKAHKNGIQDIWFWKYNVRLDEVHVL